MATKSNKPVKVVDVKPAPVTAAPGIGHNGPPVSDDAALLREVRTLARGAETARAAFRDRVLAICTGRSGGFMKDVQREAIHGFLASMIARAAGRAWQPEDDAAAAALAIKPIKTLNEAETKMRAAARRRWADIMDDARAKAPEAAPPKSAAKAAAVAKTNAKRKERAARPGISTSKGRTAKADNTGMAPSVSAAPVAKTKAEGVAHLHQGAALMLAFVERNDKALGSAIVTKAKGALRTLMDLSAAD